MHMLNDYFTLYSGDHSVTKNSDGSFSIDGDISVSVDAEFNHLPVTFKKVSGFFNCDNAGLTTLDGCPEEVVGYFSCESNKLTNLIGGPKIVNGMYFCRENPLTSYNGLPLELDGDLRCDWIENVPMLSLLKYKNVELYSDHTDSALKFYNIFKKYSGQKPLRQAIIKCQRELIDAGLKGNARL